MNLQLQNSQCSEDDREESDNNVLMYVYKMDELNDASVTRFYSDQLPSLVMLDA